MRKTYHIVNRDEKTAAASLEQFAKSNGQLLLPLIELITNARIAVDEVISSIGRKTIETILTLPRLRAPPEWEPLPTGWAAEGGFREAAARKSS